MIEVIIKLILCHLLGDYVLQIDFIAKTKGENWYHMLVHCALYVLPFIIVFGLSWAVAVSFAAHFIVDNLKARHKKINYSTDQVIHYLTALLFLI